MRTIIVWFRNDLRVHDHPALAEAAKEADHVIPVFILQDALLTGPYASANRTRFLLESLQDLKRSLQTLGADLVVRRGKAAEVLKQLVDETGASAVYHSVDYTPFAVKRDRNVQTALPKHVTYKAFPGRLSIDDLHELKTKSGTIHKVFTPFWKQWMGIQRRDIAAVPKSLSLPANINTDTIPAISDLTSSAMLSPMAQKGGETVARERLADFLDAHIAEYHQGNNDMATDRTSRLSAYLHFGCLSPREIETMLPDSPGARAWHRQLCWREFYHYVVFHFPHTHQEFQERYRSLSWGTDAKHLIAWKAGKTGYPVVDAGMRQLQSEGWMHNRARLIVGSFLTKDLWIDWREGEQHFMQWLIDGDIANNNGNWQWIASVGVDPAPVYRRLYNPILQQKNFDPTGAYVCKYVPELRNVPDAYLTEPWTMPRELQREIGCTIGTDYPAPIVDHKAARQAALEHYRSV